MPLCHSISYERVSGDLLLSFEEKKKHLFTKDSLRVKNIKISPEEVKDWEVIENLNFLNSIYARPQRFLNFRGKVDIEILILKLISRYKIRTYNMIIMCGTIKTH